MSREYELQPVRRISDNLLRPILTRMDEALSLHRDRIAALSPSSGLLSASSIILSGSAFGSGDLTIIAAALTTSHTLTFPGAQGAAGSVLANDGAGGLSWDGDFLQGNVAETVSAAWDFTGLAQFKGSGNPSVLNSESVELNDDGDFAPSVYVKTGPSSGIPNYTFLTLVDLVSGTLLYFAVDGSPTGSATLSVPASGGALITATSAIKLESKTINVGTFGTVCRFVDRADDTKLLGMNLGNWPTGTSLNWEPLVVSGRPVVAGNDPPAVAAGALGYIQDTADRSADLAATNMSSTPPAGLYLVEAYIACTLTDAGAGSMDIVVGWTDDVGATTQTLAAEPGATALPLPLTATGRSKARCLCQVASGDITVSATNTGSYGTGRYRLYIRVVALG